MPQFITIIPNFIKDPELLLGLTHSMEALSGLTTSGTHGRSKKRSTILSGPGGDLVCQDIGAQLLEFEMVSKFCFTRYATVPRLCRYDLGDYYGLHVDSPFTSGIRSDISFTAFLTSPTEYDGGELQIGFSDSEFVDIKPEAGSLVLYETGLPHRVREVTRGSRVVAVGWIESTIRDPNTRNILRDLYAALEGLDTQFPDTLETERFRLSNAITSILRVASNHDAQLNL
jgi:PKHD-type hydroxylase